MYEFEEQVKKVYPEKLRLFRKSLDYTQEQMAERLNVSISTYKKLENGKGLPSAECLFILSELSNKSMESFISAEKGDVEECWTFIMQCDDVAKLDLMGRLISYFGYDEFKNEIDKLKK